MIIQNAHIPQRPIRVASPSFTPAPQGNLDRIEQDFRCMENPAEEAAFFRSLGYGATGLVVGSIVGSLAGSAMGIPVAGGVVGGLAGCILGAKLS